MLSSLKQMSSTSTGQQEFAVGGGTSKVAAYVNNLAVTVALWRMMLALFRRQDELDDGSSNRTTDILPGENTSGGDQVAHAECSFDTTSALCSKVGLKLPEWLDIADPSDEAIAAVCF